jgi:opacity protein-like surface antigen
MKKLSLAAAAIAAMIASSAALAFGTSVELANGDDVNMGRIGLQWWEWQSQRFRSENWHFGGYTEFSVGYWHTNDVKPGEHSSLVDFGLTPVLRLERNTMEGPYAEMGLGVHGLSHTSIGGNRMSTGFQFGSHIGLGYRFGTKQAFDLSYRFQHLSNAGIKHPNSGVNFNELRLQYSF